MRSTCVNCLICLLIIFGWSAGGQASDYPNRYIRVIVGPGIDTPARIIGDEIAKRLHTQVVVESKPVAGGALAMNTLVTGSAGWLYDAIGNGCVYDQYRHRPIPIGFAQGVCSSRARYRRKICSCGKPVGAGQFVRGTDCVCESATRKAQLCIRRDWYPAAYGWRNA